MKTSSCVTIADVTIEISCNETQIQHTASTPVETDYPFKPVEASHSGDITVQINSLPSPPHAGKKIISGEDNLWQLYTLGDGFLDCRFHSRSPDIPYWWACMDRYYNKIDIGVNIQAIRSAADGRLERVRADKFATERKLMIPALLNQGVLVVHGAGGTVQGKGLVIAGTSGSGKSTMAKLMVKAGHPMFSDEAIAVRLQNDTGWLAYGTPWPSSAGIVRDESAPLAVILFLHQAEKTSLHRISRADCLKRLLQFCSIPWYLPHLADEALDVCERLVAEIPMFQMECSLEDDPVKAIERLTETF